ncbi:MAG TPA: DUF503 domain-containing protein [Planctomycetota bacterium]|nr:DUF503 domain-containing protein [Planctomycetota bacterium]
MIVGTLRIRLVLRGARSLKDKRRVIKSLKDRLHNTFNVSVAEVDHQDLHQQATLGVAMTGTDRRHVNEVLSKLVDHVRRNGAAELVDYELEMF